LADQRAPRGGGEGGTESPLTAQRRRRKGFFSPAKGKRRRTSLAGWEAFSRAREGGRKGTRLPRRSKGKATLSLLEAFLTSGGPSSAEGKRGNGRVNFLADRARKRVLFGQREKKLVSGAPTRLKTPRPASGWGRGRERAKRNDYQVKNLATGKKREKRLAVRCADASLGADVLKTGGKGGTATACERYKEKEGGPAEQDPGKKKPRSARRAEP